MTVTKFFLTVTIFSETYFDTWEGFYGLKIYIMRPDVTMECTFSNTKRKHKINITLHKIKYQMQEKAHGMPKCAI